MLKAILARDYQLVQAGVLVLAAVVVVVNVSLDVIYGFIDPRLRISMTAPAGHPTQAPEERDRSLHPSSRPDDRMLYSAAPGVDRAGCSVHLAAQSAEDGPDQHACAVLDDVLARHRPIRPRHRLPPHLGHPGIAKGRFVVWSRSPSSLAPSSALSLDLQAAGQSASSLSATIFSWRFRVSSWPSRLWRPAARRWNRSSSL